MALLLAVVRGRCGKESSRSLSHLLMSFLYGELMGQTVRFEYSVKYLITEYTQLIPEVAINYYRVIQNERTPDSSFKFVHCSTKTVLNELKRCQKCVVYSQENLTTHTGVPSTPFPSLPSFPLPYSTFLSLAFPPSPPLPFLHPSLSL